MYVTRQIPLALAVIVALCNASGAFGASIQNGAAIIPAVAGQDAKADAKELLRERLRLLGEVARLQREAYSQGEATFDAVVSAEFEVLNARLELAATAAERITIRGAMLDSAIQLEKIVAQLLKEGQATPIDVLRAKCLRLRAKADLLREDAALGK